MEIKCASTGRVNASYVVAWNMSSYTVLLLGFDQSHVRAVGVDRAQLIWTRGCPVGGGQGDTCSLRSRLFLNVGLLLRVDCLVIVIFYFTYII